MERFSRLEFAVSDAARGIGSAVAAIGLARRDDPSAPALEHGLDVFHTAMAARRVLARHGRRAEAAWEQAEAAEAQVADAKQQGIDARGRAPTARAAWRQATMRFEQVQPLEAAWGRVAATLELFRADGPFHDRARVQAAIAAALRDRPGPDWAKLRNFLNDPRSLSFLDRRHRRLEVAEPGGPWRAAMAWRWWRRHRQATAPDPLTALWRAVGRDRPRTAEPQASDDRVAAVLTDTVRASSVVECLNSVWRMPPSRHRRRTQPMLDLKRRYGNGRPLRCGPRQDTCPDQALGLELPTYDFWALLQSDPERLAQELSTSWNAE